MKTLYVSRPVLNGEEFIDWAKSQGFTKTLSSEDFHVTVAFSRTAVDWDSITPKKNTITFQGGVRTVQPLGAEGAVVLKFKGGTLQGRWREFRDIGASWDYESYQPHVSITYDGTGVDLAGVEPFVDNLVLGPEKFEELDLDWSKNVDEVEK